MSKTNSRALPWSANHQAIARNTTAVLSVMEHYPPASTVASKLRLAVAIKPQKVQLTELLAYAACDGHRGVIPI